MHNLKNKCKIKSTYKFVAQLNYDKLVIYLIVLYDHDNKFVLNKFTFNVDSNSLSYTIF